MRKVSRATAPGKCILFGEHAVVYGRPAIAIPVMDVEARAELRLAEGQGGFRIDAPDLARNYLLAQAPLDDPLAKIIHLTLARIGQAVLPEAVLQVTSTIPLGRGLGSGAALSTAIARALAQFFEVALPPADISALVYEVEKIYHGMPSGIDNTVIAFEQPLYFIKGQPIQPLRVARSLTLIIADTGRVAPTYEVVADLRRRWQAEPEPYERYFDQIGAIVKRARTIIEQGDDDISTLGRLMNDNQQILAAVGVSSPELQQLVEAARQAGALGAKLSGAGWGGNMIALVWPHAAPGVVRALQAAGATKAIVTTVG